MKFLSMERMFTNTEACCWD